MFFLNSSIHTLFRYHNVAKEPNAGGRIIVLSVNDGTFTSENVTSAINFTFINDVPILSPNQKLFYTEGQGSLLIWPNLQIEGNVKNLSGQIKPLQFRLYMCCNSQAPLPARNSCICITGYSGFTM